MPSLKKLQLVFFLTVLCLAGSRVFAQDIPISGNVKTESGTPLSGASVTILPTSKGVITDNNGNFNLRAGKSDRLLISFIGYDSVIVKAQSSINVRLHQRGTALTDVVVIGYGSVRKQELTGAVSTVTEKDFQHGTITTPEQLISGKVAGVSITANGGEPGSGSTIRIRGVASLNGSQDPLIVIDGLPINQDLGFGASPLIAGASNPLSLINPDDIESFTVLKDGASTAIYGSRASNGVILITTKKGARGKAVVSFTTNTSVSTIAKEQQVFSAAQFRAYVDSTPLGSSIVSGMTVPFKSLLGNSNTDWQKEIYRAAISTDNNISIAGTAKKINTPYRFSLEYLNADGLLKTDNLQRYAAGISLTPTLLKNTLKVTLNAKGIMEDTRFGNGAAVGAAVYYDPTQSVYTPGSQYGGYTEWSTNGSYNKLAPQNPLGLLEEYNNSSKVYRSFGNLQLDYKLPFLPDVHANLNLGYDVAQGHGLTYVPAYAAQNFLDSGQNNPYKSTVSNTISEFYLSYNKTLPSIKSNINATAGYGFYKNTDVQYSYNRFRANGDTIPSTNPNFPTTPEENSLLSYYARLIYTYNTKYILAASVRQDQSSRFPNEGSSGTMPSVAFTWRINKEKWFSNAKNLSLLNLRLSYGVTGNQAGIGNYMYQQSYSPSGASSLVQFGNTFYNPATPAAYNLNIQWEKTQASNIGIDYGFFNNRITGTIDAYYKNTTELLNTVPVAAGTGFSNVFLENIGNMTNKGVEFAINLIPVSTRHFSWNMNFNVAYNETNITKLNNGDNASYVGALNPNGVQINSVGFAPNAFYVYHQEYDKNGKPLEGVYADLNKDGVINTSDLYQDHSPFPKFIFGFTTQFTLDKWSLSTVLRANLGNYVYNQVATASAQSNTFNELGYLVNSLASITKTNFAYNQSSSDMFVENASFLKMDNLTLGYDFGKLGHAKMLALQLNAYCQNVFTVTKYTGIDPEIYGGYDAVLYPRPRIVGVSANIKF